MKKRQCIVITGSSGQIGTNLGLKLLENGYDVHGVDCRRNTWTSEVRTHLMDLCTSDLDADFRRRGIAPDAIVHLAANAKVHGSVELPSQAFDNIRMAEHVLEYCRVYNVPIIFSSSREVYGNLPLRQFNETNADFAATASPYAASKIAAESLIYSYAQCYGLRYIVFRLSNVYGRYDCDLERMERVVPSFIRSIQRREVVTVFGADKMLDFTYVDDCVDGLFRGIGMLLDRQSGNVTINLAAGSGNSLVMLAQYIGEELGIPPVLNIRQARKGEVKRYIADLANARAMLGFRPRTTLRDGIRKAIAWQKDWGRLDPVATARSA